MNPLMMFSVASSAVQGIGSFIGGMQEASYAKANERISRENAGRARRDAGQAEEAHRRTLAKELGRAAAAAAESGAAGGGPGRGSYGALINQSAKEGELDALNIRYGGELEAVGHLTDAANYRAQRKAARAKAWGGLISGALGSASAGLTANANARLLAVNRKMMAPGAPIVGGPAYAPGRRL